MLALIVVLLGLSDGVVTSGGVEVDEPEEDMRRSSVGDVVHIPLFTVQNKGLSKRANGLTAIGLGDVEDRYVI